MPFVFAGYVMSALKSALGSWRLWLALGVAAAFAVVAGTAYLRGKDIETLKAEKATLATKLEATGKLLSEQNRAVANLKAASDEQAARAANAAKTAQRAIGAANARIAVLQRATVPTACPDALEWLRDQASRSALPREAQ
jgi:hypothetical protein